MTAAAALKVSRKVPRPSPPQWARLHDGPSMWVTGPTPGSAVTYNGVTYIGFVDLDGHIRVAAYNHATHATTVSPTLATAAADAHCTPTVVVRNSDQKIVVAATGHNIAHMYIAVSTNAEDVSAFGATADIISSIGGTSLTYAQIIQLSGESNKLYLFWREGGATNAALYYSTSTDGGSTWAARTLLYSNTGKGSYWSIDSDNTGRIDIVTTDGTADHADTASVYHFYYDGAWRKSDGTSMGSPPFTPSSLTLISDGSVDGSANYAQQIISGSPLVACWGAYDSGGGGNPENYWYATYSSGWSKHVIATSNRAANAGGAGGFAVDAMSTSRAYLTRIVDGVWQLLVYETGDGGATWTETAQLTDEATGEWNVGPLCPRGAAAAMRCVWLFGPPMQETPAGLDQVGGIIRGYPNPIHVF